MFNRKVNINRVRTTSKIALRLSCLEACENDIERAAALYDYIAQGLDLPDSDPVIPTGLERVRQGADDVLAWIGSHESDIARGVSLFRSVTQRSAQIAATTAADVPPIPTKI